MKNLLPVLLLFAAISCKKMDDYSYEGGYTQPPQPPPVTQVSNNASNPSDSGVLNDLDVSVSWSVYDSGSNIVGSVGQDPHALGNVNQLFAYPYFNMTSTDTVSRFYVEWYRSFPMQKPSDLLERKEVELYQPIPFVPEHYQLSDVKLIRITQ